MKTTSCFISYSWDSDEHIKWVLYLAKNLQENGVQTYIDQWDVHPGADLAQYMEKSIRESNFVILVCTPSFANKANKGQGGVGYEKSIVTGEIFYGASSPGKFVPILRSGTPQNSLPSYLKNRKYVDFNDDKRFRTSFEELLRHLLGASKHKRPQLGTKLRLSADRVKPTISFKFKEIYQFANSREGMYLSRDFAEDFTREWIEKYYDKDFEVFKVAYLFAHDIDGMRLTHQDAEDFALEWIEQYSDKDFQVFSEAYLFARSREGLYLTHEEAEDFAFEQISEQY